MTNLTTRITTRITERIAQDRAMLAAGTQGKWQTRFLYRMFRAVRNHQTTLGLMMQGDDTKDWPDAELSASCVNDKEGELLVIEGLLDSVCEWECDCLPCAKLKAILTRWIEGRERDEKG